MEQGWLIVRNESCTIGLFQGMIGRNTLTFNPGWDAAGQPLAAFEDIREIQARLRAGGVSFADEAEADGAGPASFLVIDPDGNPVLVDQHVDRPPRG